MKHFYFQIRKNFAIHFHGKLLFTTILFVLCNFSLFAQCKLEKSKDDYSSSQSISSKEVTLASVFPLIGTKKPWDLVMSFLLVDSTCTIIVTHKDQASSSNLEYIYFKFKDGSVLKKENAFDAGTYNTGLGYRFASTGFIITKDELKQFGSVDLLKFQASLKYNINYPLVDEEIKQKSIEKIRKDASCMLDEYNSISFANNEIKKDVKPDALYECTYETDKKDDFTKKRSVLTKAAVFWDVQLGSGGHNFFNVCGSNIGGVNGLKFHYFVTSKTGVKLADEASLKSVMLFDQVDILLENDEVISLKDNESSVFLNQVYTVWSYKLYNIETDSIWQKLKTIPVKKIRLSIAGKELGTQDVDKKSSESIINVIKCVDALGIPKPI